MFKRTRFAAIMAIVVAIVAANTADARPGGSYRSGFSSGRSTASRSVSTPKQPSFGTFGQRQSQPPAAARTPQRDSAMSRDLDRRAAQDQAMRTYDTRRAGTAGQAAPGSFGSSTATRTGTTPPLPPLDPVVPGGRGSGSGGYNNGAYAQHGAPGNTSAPAPVIVRDSSNGWLWGIGGFMLGRAASGHAAPAPAPAPAVQPAPSTQQPVDVSGNTGAMADAAGASDIATSGAAAGAVVEPVRQPPVQAPAAKPAAQESSTLAKLAVALLAGCLVWLAWKAFRLMAGAQEVKKNANYSFERN
ncbi:MULTISPECIES: hypothetical protein [unclassified Duganella]|uniref:hypothetical protein n=1 Tax=unclassified Duganella TaxID=2636909 RepID=UPI0006FD68B3|nr:MULTISPECIES: hypothetical protein [unclassified Duganella]KQV43086.1 hypothetical protein ASD07_21885 [Duganella sp. Root336D2]